MSHFSFLHSHFTNPNLAPLSSSSFQFSIFHFNRRCRLTVQERGQTLNQLFLTLKSRGLFWGIFPIYRMPVFLKINPMENSKLGRIPRSRNLQQHMFICLIVSVWINRFRERTMPNMKFNRLLSLMHLIYPTIFATWR